MIDHANRIASKRERESENERMEELERKAAPLFWLVYVVAFVVCCMVIYDNHKTHKNLELMTADFEAVQKGEIIGVGDDGVMYCTVRKIIGEGK